MDRDAILLTPGPLTTTLRTKLAMLKDWGSWDTDFIAVTASVRTRLLDIIDATARTPSCPCKAVAPSAWKRLSPPWCRQAATCWCWTTARTASAQHS